MHNKNNLSTAQRIAKTLLQIKAVTLSPRNPYKFVSGIISPIYTDNRLLMGYPIKRKEITIYMVSLMKEKGLEPDVIAGTSTAGIPPAAWLAEMLNLPMIYVRNSVKDHGKGKQIEGVLKRGENVLLVEDLISTGKSSLSAVDAIRASGGKIDTCIAFFDYGLEQSKKEYKKREVNLFTLTSLEALLLMAQKMNLINSRESLMVLNWQKDPWNWPKKAKLKNKGYTVDY